ncbi:exported hypothetical protein [Verrucomicrobia bacterium]|nr:exported hypothetical protein [Verrucomicrobiota bacterium]
MKTLTLSLLLSALAPLVASGRPFQVTEPKALFSDSKLVFVGRVKTVKPSKITTRLSYPAWEGVTFRWLIAEVEVLDPLKGVQRGDIVCTAMLSIDENEDGDTPIPPMPPGLLEPEKGDVFLLCLGPTPLTNVFAALRAPWDENLSVFVLHRIKPSQRRLSHLRDEVLSKDERFAPLWSLTDKAGRLVPGAVERVRQAYAAQLSSPPADRRIFLEWETYTNQSGWMSDAPKGYRAMTNLNTRK